MKSLLCVVFAASLMVDPPSTSAAEKKIGDSKKNVIEAKVQCQPKLGRHGRTYMTRRVVLR